MTRIAYVDGRYRPIGAPAVRVEDRGLQFADGVYEVIKCLGGSVRTVAHVIVPSAISSAT